MVSVTGEADQASLARDERQAQIAVLEDEVRTSTDRVAKPHGDGVLSFTAGIGDGYGDKDACLLLLKFFY